MKTKKKHKYHLDFSLTPDKYFKYSLQSII